MNLKLVVSVLLITLVSSCKFFKKDSNKETVSENNRLHDSKWSVIGTEPFWNIQIDSSKVLFTMLNERIDSVYFTINDYESIDNSTSFTLTDKRMDTAFLRISGVTNCSDGMSDNPFQYSATFNYKGLELNGCAEKK
jgi:uncharacterized membrane protein